MPLRFAALACLFLAAPALAQTPDVMRAGPLDNGTMWLFENPPVEHLASTYNFRPDAAWFERARLSSLRLPGCSAAFVSTDGLVVTNHHCLRGRLVNLSEPGEDLLNDGFFARSLAEERRMPEYYVDQLVEIDDVTERVTAAAAGAQTEAERVEARRVAIEAIEEGGTTGDRRVQVVSLYNGGRYSAYTFRRYADLRLVAAPELALSDFGGADDNYTFPRYALDFTFLRAYGPDGEPLDTADFHYPWSTEGAQPGDLIFVVGSPGGTFRGESVAQIEWRRDVEVPAQLQWLRGRMTAVEAYLAENVDDGTYRTRMLSLENLEKRYAGRADALADRVIMSRRRDFERGFQQAIAADADLRATYGSIHRAMADVVRQKRELAPDYSALARLGSERYVSATLLRGLYTAQFLALRERGLPASTLAEMEAVIRDVADQPDTIDRGYLAAQLRELQRYLEPGFVDPVLAGRTPAEAAEAMIAESALRSASRAASALASGTLSAGDPVVALARQILPRYQAYQSAAAGLSAQESDLASQLGAARFAVYGTAVPPDGSSSLRLSDGVVRGYEYNGTVAPPYTTFFGLFDRNAAFGQGTAWTLPERWRPAPAALDQSTPLNLVSTSDTVGGSSGAPAVDRDLRLVGVNFDRTIEGLSRDFIYFPDRGRNVMVDARGVLEALDSVYDLDRLVQELRTGEAVATEAEADALQP